MNTIDTDNDVLNKLNSSVVANTYEAGELQQTMIDAALRVPQNMGGDLVVATKLIGDEFLHLAIELKKEVGLDVDMSVLNKKDRQPHKLIDKGAPTGKADGIASSNKNNEPER